MTTALSQSHAAGRFAPEDVSRLEEQGLYELEEKIAEYLAADVKVVWAVNPKFRWVRVHRPGAPLVELRENDNLSAEDILPGFSVPVRHILPARNPHPQAMV